MEVIILASSSSGNAIYIKDDKTSILIDMGISINKITQKLARFNESIDSVSAIFITHEHGDHTKGLISTTSLGYKKFSNTFMSSSLKNKPIYISSKSLDGLRDDSLNLVDLQADTIYQVGSINVTPFLLSHDAMNTFGFLIESKGKKISLIADTGFIDDSLNELLENCDLYILETNHDEELEIRSQRPPEFKRRVLGIKGHLSNNYAFNFIVKVASKPCQVCCYHISSECNTKDRIVREFINHKLDPTIIQLIITPKDGLNERIIV